MRNRKITIISAGTLLLVLALAIAAGAQQRKERRAGFGNNVAQGIVDRQFIKGLRLTETQREDIKAILQGHRMEILNAREALLRARLALVKEEPNGPQDFGAAQAGLMELRQNILNQIKAKLTQEQLEALQKKQQARASHLERMLERLQSAGGN